MHTQAAANFHKYFANKISAVLFNILYVFCVVLLLEMAFYIVQYWLVRCLCILLLILLLVLLLLFLPLLLVHDICLKGKQVNECSLCSNTYIFFFSFLVDMWYVLIWMQAFLYNINTICCTVCVCVFRRIEIIRGRKGRKIQMASQRLHAYYYSKLHSFMHDIGLLSVALEFTSMKRRKSNESMFCQRV